MVTTLRKRKQGKTIASYEESDSDFASDPELRSKTQQKRAKTASREKKKKQDTETEESDTEVNQLESSSQSDKDESDSDNVTQFKPAKIKVPHPDGSPFPDSLSPKTLEFLAELAENNDRDFMHFKAKEFQEAKQDFIDFCGLIRDELAQVDPSIRLEEPKQAVYRQNRDLRFSNDKRPYKINLSASFSRTGRKFADAGYFLSIRPGNHSMIASGMWQPDKHRLANMRSSIIRHGDLLRESLSTEAIKDVFHGKSGVEILSPEDKLKVAPKDIDKHHPEIELLRYRSFAVVKEFTDQEVVSPGFVEKVMDFLEATVPFVTVVNSWI
ncbi:hypothetical protein A0J61_02302 [Choanephora cucurbitarum]|uniref:Uncharacterized protein n=1 Tax=Choanephora cucurbitarum TaxID=101091 RepID=A0A1C7NMF5_9FUNG|nr:hypothetical protein A0J61_02302 [Choanephora cucurbitarum]